MKRVLTLLICCSALTAQAQDLECYYSQGSDGSEVEQFTLSLDSSLSATRILGDKDGSTLIGSVQINNELSTISLSASSETHHQLLSMATFRQDGNWYFTGFGPKTKLREDVYMTAFSCRSVDD